MKRGGSHSLDSAKRRLREAGLRSTNCRVEVLQHLTAADCPKTHLDVAEALVATGCDKSTIYRCLIDLTEAGLLTRLELGDHVWRFELRGPAKPGSAERGSGKHGEAEHPHFMCVDCGKVACLGDVTINIGANETAAGLNVTEILLKGRCDECQ